MVNLKFQVLVDPRQHVEIKFWPDEYQPHLGYETVKLGVKPAPWRLVPLLDIFFIPPSLEISIDLGHVVTGRVNTVNRLVGESILPIRPKHAPQIQKTFRPLWLVKVPFGTLQTLVKHVFLLFILYDAIFQPRVYLWFLFSHAQHIEPFRYIYICMIFI